VIVSPPPDETERAIMRLVVRTFPQGGAQHERAIRMALRLGWSAAIAVATTTKETVDG
jgi:hypothetical protein